MGPRELAQKLYREFQSLHSRQHGFNWDQIYVMFLHHINKAYEEGCSNMLGSIRGSLEGYPDSGGDIEVMRLVDKILLEFGGQG